MRWMLLLFFSASVLSGQTPADHANLKGAVALSGYDPVSYYEGGPQKGRDDLFEEREGVRYFFVSESNRQAFNANPEKYTPAYGGWCAYAMLDGDKVEVDPERYKLIDGRLYLFYDGFWGDTLKRWNKKIDKVPESALVAQADEAWLKILNQ